MKKILLFLTMFGILLSTANVFSETTTTLKTEKIKYPKGIRKCNICNGSFRNRTANYTYYFRI